MSSYATPGGLVSMGVAFMVLGIVVVALRFHTRLIGKMPMLWDDWLILPATVLMISSCISLIVGVAGKGLGYPTPGLSGENPLFFNPPQSVLAEKVEFVIITFQPLTLGFTKLSIVFFYRRIFCDRASRSPFGAITWITIGLIILWTISFFFAWLFSCGIHIDAQWGPIEDLVTECINTLNLNEAYAISDFIMDMIVFLLPIYPIWQLRMPLARRIAVLLILMLGALTIVASAIRMAICIILVEGIDSSFITEDEDLLVSILLYWTVLESGLAIIVANLPTFRFLFSKLNFADIIGSLRSKLSYFSSRSGSSTSRSGSNFNTLENENERNTKGYETKSTVELKSFIGVGMNGSFFEADPEAGLPPKSSHTITVRSDIDQVVAARSLV